MNILITNDDGVFAPGLAALAAAFRTGHAVTIVAPDSERSAFSHKITLGHPLRCHAVSLPDGHPAHAVDGTPADCVKFALATLFERPPDLVLSGINKGPNMGVDIRYSGTVAAAFEAAVNGVPGVAVSLGDVLPPLRFEAAARVAREIVDRLLNDFPFDRAVANLNLPNRDQPNGVRYTRVNGYRYATRIESRRDPRGHAYHWMDGEKDFTRDPDPDSDALAVRDGYASVSPLTIDLTETAILGIMRAIPTSPKR